jgi:short-subunit dehydrogenase
MASTPARAAERLTALVTGASSGIGEALAHCFAQGHFDLVLVARSADKLEALARHMAAEHGVKARALPCDLSQPGAASGLAAQLKSARRPIDVLVNNAGVLEFGAFADMPPARHAELVGLNVLALTEMLAQFVPPMVKRGRGRILNVASIAAFQPVPGLATYAATKAYVLSITETLAIELAETGVSATALCPGITDTHMLSAAQGGHGRLKKLPGLVIGDVAEVAAAGYRACLAGEVICVPGTLNLAATMTSRAAPRWLVRRLAGTVSKLVK